MNVPFHLVDTEGKYSDSDHPARPSRRGQHPRWPGGIIVPFVHFPAMKPPASAATARPGGTAIQSPAWLPMLFAVSCGLIVANLYYSQPLVGPIASELGMSPAAAGLLMALAQIGYGLGLLFIDGGRRFADRPVRPGWLGAGSALGAWTHAHGGWTPACWTGLALPVVALPVVALAHFLVKVDKR